MSRLIRLGIAASAVLTLTAGAPAAFGAGPVGLPPPTASNLHPCSRVTDGLSPWKDRNDETGYTVWGTSYAYDWWGKGGSCPAARFVAVQVVEARGPASVLSPVPGSSGHQRCYVTRDDAGNRIEPFASIFCEIKGGRKHHFGVLVAPYPVAIDGWFWNDGNQPPCTDPDNCPSGPPGLPEATPAEVDTVCGLKQGDAVCHISSNPGRGARATVTLSRNGRQIGKTSVTFGDDQLTTLTIHGSKPLQPATYDLHVVIVYNGSVVTDETGPVAL
jgi:hypothetical protein